MSIKFTFEFDTIWYVFWGKNYYNENWENKSNLELCSIK